MSLARLAKVTLMWFTSVVFFLIHDSCCVTPVYLELVEATKRVEGEVKRDCREDQERVLESLEADVDFAALHHQSASQGEQTAEDSPHD